MRLQPVLAAFAIVCAGTAIGYLLQAHPQNIATAVPAKESLSTYYFRVLAFWEKEQVRDPYSYIAAQKIAATHMAIARATGDESHYRQAEQILLEARKITPPKEYSTEGLLARALMSRHAFKEALQIANTLRESEPSSAFYLELHADAALGLGDYEAAFQDFDTLLAKHPGFTAYARAAEKLELLGKGSDAEEYLEKARKEYDGTGAEPAAWILFRIGQNHLRSGDLDKAARVFEEALRKIPEYTLPLAPLAETYELKGSTSEAKRILLKAVTTNPTPMAFQRLAALARQAGETTKAAEFSDEALRRAAQRAGDGTGGHSRELAEILLCRKEDLPKAIELIKQDLLMREGDLRSQYIAARAYRYLGQPGVAREHIRSALRLGTKDVHYYLEAAAIETACGDAKAAKTYQELANAILPGAVLREDVL